MKKRILLLAAFGIAAAVTLVWFAWAANRSTQGRDTEVSGQKEVSLIITDKFTPAEIGCVKLTGLLGKHVDSVPSRLLEGQREAYIEVFETPVDANSWRAEHLGKWLETACNTMMYNKGTKLRAATDDVVDRLLKLQQPDGWLGSYAPEYRFQNYDWKKNAGKKYEPFWDGPFYDVWCHYLTMGGLIRYYEANGNPCALHAAQKIADLLIETFGEGKQDIMLINHDHGFGPGVGIFPFSKLYLLTGEVRYRDFCKYLTAQYGRTGKVPIMMTEIRKDQYPFPDWAQIKHCEFELCLAGLCQLYRGTGDQDLFATCQNIYDGYFAPLTETICFHGFKTPPPGMRVPDTYYGFLETCDIVPMLRWFMEMARITGDSQYLDALEWNLYNSLLSRDLPDGRVWPGHDVPKTDIFHCCYSMLSVGLSYIPSWVYCTTPDGIMVDLYESSVFSGQVAGVNTTIEQTTQYPLDGTVNLTIKPQKSIAFELLLRIPRWCKNAKVFVNGNPQLDTESKSGSFLKLNRQWGTSDTVKLVLDMPARTIHREFGGEAARSVVTVERGPLLLALTARLNPDVPLDKVSLQVEPDGTMSLVASSPLDPAATRSVTFSGTGIMTATESGKTVRKTTPILLSPYVYSGVSDKPVPAPKQGVFNVYSEDGVGDKVRVEFPPAAASRTLGETINQHSNKTRVWQLNESWKNSVDAAALVKSDLSASDYQYPIIGNGGLNLLADPLGFTAMKPKNAPYAASLEYCYWWNNATARLRPFAIQAVYDDGGTATEGAVESFLQRLDMGTGTLTTSLNLGVGSARFTSTRTAFVTRDGVLVMRVSDSVGHKLQIKVSALPGYTLNYTAMPNGLCAASSNPDHNFPVLAVMAIGADVLSDDKSGTVSVSLAPGKEVVLFIAASSGLENSGPVEAASRKALTASEKGYAANQSGNTSFWKDFWSKSSISLPDENLQKWYVRSQYYHGAMMANSPIPLGCFGPRHEGFLGGPCPEYDLSFNFLAMMTANQAEVTAPVADWIEKTLPEARKLAAVYIPGSTGARYAWVSSWDGKESRFCGNTSSPVDNGWEAFPSACCALMDLMQAQYTKDAGRLEIAKNILELTTQHQLDNSEQDQQLQRFWVSKKFLWTWNAPWFFTKGVIQDQAALLWSLRTARDLGVGTDSWSSWANEVFIPTGYDNTRGQEVILGFKGATTANIVVPMLYPFYFLTTISGDDPLAQPTYINVTQSKDIDYIFNRGWAACVAARGGCGDEALTKLHRLTEEKDALIDDTYLCEVKNIPANSPEIGAHAMVMQGVQEMLMNGISPTMITVFPALPVRWEECGVSFQNLLANGAIAVSACYTEASVSVTLENLADLPAERTLLVRIPSIFTQVFESGGIPIEEIYKGRFAKLTLTVPAYGTKSIALQGKSGGTSWASIDDSDQGVQYTSNWNALTNASGHHNHTVHYSNIAGSAVNISFSGRSVRIIGDRNADHGQMKVVLDGVLQGYFDTWSPVPVKQAVLFAMHGLAPKKHVIELTTSGIKSDYSTGTSIAFDAVQYLDTNQKLTELDDTLSFTYQGEWTSIKDQPGFYGKSAHFSEVAGSSAELAFNGEGVRLIGSRKNDHGLATIVLDGKTLTTIDLYSFSETSRQVLWESPPLSKGDHILKVVVTGSKNVNSRGSRITLDAVEIVGDPHSAVGDEPRRVFEETVCTSSA